MSGDSMDDLDSLLEDLGAGSNDTVDRSRATSTKVDLNELEELMEDLAAPTPRATMDSSGVGDDMDDLLNSLGTPSKAEPVVVKEVYPSDPDPSDDEAETGGGVGEMGDLDDLLNDLTPSNEPDDSSSAKTIHLQPQSVPEPEAATEPEEIPVAHPSIASDDLDKLLGNLNDQMADVDTSNPASRGTCSMCSQAILGEVIQAAGKTYHPEHWSCNNCRKPLGTANFYETDGGINCEKCYKELFCPRCAHCDEAIFDRCITALGKKWHMDHFICTTCLKPFEGGNFYERDGKPFCEADFYSVFAPRCGGCDQSIKGDSVNALGAQWHPQCFVCQYCEKSFGSGTFFEYGGKPYCEQHYHQQTGSMCGGCGKSITGRCVNALDKKYHPEHFVCAFCMNPLATDSYIESNSKAYCKECHKKLFN